MTPEKMAQALSDLLLSDAWFVDVLRAAGEVAPPEWVVGAGVIRTLCWDRLHGYEAAPPIADVDVAYFDASDLRRASEVEYELRLSDLKDLDWDVKNQAAVHLWYEKRFGRKIPPVLSITDAVARFPETATSVAVRPNDQGGLEIMAPCGLEDLFQMRLRRNPKQVSEDYFRKRILAKDVTARWPQVEILYE